LKPWTESSCPFGTKNHPKLPLSSRHSTLGYAFLATSGHRLETYKPESPSGRMTGAKHILAGELRCYSLLTVLLPWFATQMLAPSKAMPAGWFPTLKLPSLAPSLARSLVTVLLP
jgi:hypothetical protein